VERRDKVKACVNKMVHLGHKAGMRKGHEDILLNPVTCLASASGSREFEGLVGEVNGHGEVGGWGNESNVQKRGGMEGMRG